MIVVDTTVVSDLMRPNPKDAVARWVHSHSPRELFTTAVTLAEVRYGPERPDAGRRKAKFTAAAEEILKVFGEFVLPFDRKAAITYAAIVNARNRAGSPIDGFDAQIADICFRHHATLATRTIKDFVGTGIEITDPWQPS